MIWVRQQEELGGERLPPSTLTACLQTENERGALICADMLLALGLPRGKVLVTVETSSLVRTANRLETKFFLSDFLPRHLGTISEPL